jgi:hypothetical protein
MISPLHIKAMREAMQEKLATRALHHGTREFEEMSAPRWKQFAKDAPVIAVGSGAGYALGRLVGEQLGWHCRLFRLLRQSLQRWEPMP